MTRSVKAAVIGLLLVLIVAAEKVYIVRRVGHG